MSTAVNTSPARLPLPPAEWPLFSERLRFLQPTIPPLERVMELYQASYSRGLITNGSLVARLEAEVAARLGVAHCIAVSSCTSGLTLVLRALDLSGEVVLPSFTFFATGHAALWNKLRPVFADCDSETWTLDPADVERKISERTCAVIGVHLYGNPCNVDALSHLATRYGLKLILDAAHAFGSFHRGRPVGRFGDAEVFSLSPTKPLVAGEGGFVTTGDALLARRIRAARNYGDTGNYNPELLGLNARMSEFHAAMALAGLDMVSGKVHRHNQIARKYTKLLSVAPGLQFQRVRPADSSTYKDYSVLVEPDVFGLSRDELAVALLSENIETKKYFYPPMHRQKLYSGYYDSGDEGLLQTEHICRSVLSLPIYESLTDQAVDKIAFAITRLSNG